MKRVLEFLELRNWEDFEHKPENVGGYSESMDAKTTERLRAYFRPHNERLWEWLGERWDWQG